VAGTFLDAGSPSMVIAIADSPIANRPVENAPPPVLTAVPPAIPSFSTMPPIVSPPVATAQPFVFPNADEPVSAAGRYVAQRERHRRKQFVFAMILLVAVIVLTGVLIFVLQRGAETSAVMKTAAAGSDAHTSVGHIAVFAYAE
jgi:hypothetical protein